jgi:hypothetical protein
MIFAGVLSLLVTWWSSPLDRAKGSLYSTFDQRDIVPIGYAAFALALGVTAGLLIRRAIPAMAATLVAFVATLLAVGKGRVDATGQTMPGRASAASDAP